MNYQFNLEYGKYGDTNGKLCFELNNEKYNFELNVYTPDCDEYDDNVNCYYFTYEKINEYGAKLCYVEYVNCFERFVNDKIKNTLFGTKFKKENKEFFLEINDFIIKEVKKHFNIRKEELDLP